MIKQDDDDTALVDGLLKYTRQLVEESKSPRHVVAYSGGVDSSLVTALLQQVCDNEAQQVQAVLGLSPAVSQEQVNQAQVVANHLKIPLKQIHTQEGSDDLYIANDGQACFACKTHLYDSLLVIHQSLSRNNNIQLYNGTNADDLQDSTRVGLLAAANFSVYSPLSKTCKQDVRRAARHLGLPNWNAAAAPCLRSRLALGIQATQLHLNMIEQAEDYVKRRLLSRVLEPVSNVRVRMLTKQRAMIEVDANLLHHLMLGRKEQAYFQKLGFSSVSAREFRTGSVARRRTTSNEQQDDDGVDNELATALG